MQFAVKTGKHFVSVPGVPWCNGGSSVISMFSTAVQFFLGPLNLGELQCTWRALLKKYNLLGEWTVQGEKGFLQPGLETLLSFGAVLNPFH